MTPLVERCPNCFGELPMDPCRHCGWQMGGTVEPFYLPPGTLLDGRYRVGRVLGHGGFGITYLGWDENLGIRLAIKEYLPRDLATRTGAGTSVVVYSGSAQDAYDHGLTCFQEEARTLARFEQHPGIVSVYNFFLANDTGYMVMEYVGGNTLKAYLERKGALSYETTRKILLPVMGALCAVHAEGLLHRDIAPDNVYITRDKRVKLLDFGAARFVLGEHSRSLSIILKPGYAPEEQYRSRGNQGAWSDIYGLAATFYRCLTGEKPPDALDRLEHDNLRAPSTFGITLPVEAEQMLLKGLAVKAEDRPADMASFQQPFLKHDWQAGGAAPAPAPEVGRREETPILGDFAQAETTSKPAAAPPRTEARGAVRAPQKRLGWMGGVGWVGLLAGVLWAVSGGEPTLLGPLGVLLVALWMVHSSGSRAPTYPTDPQAQFTLGLKYDTGDGVPKDDVQAVVWYRKAAEQGHAEAQLNLGFAYNEGLGVPQDDAQAVAWWCKAAEQGNAVAQFMFGVMYTNGRGVPQNDTQAATWYRMAAEQEHAWAQVSLGLMYVTGRGVPQDDVQAVAWYRKAATSSDPEAARQAREAIAELGAR